MLDISFSAYARFTGSNKIAKHLCVLTEGKIRIEDAGFNWKILGRDVGDEDFVAFTCDQVGIFFSVEKILTLKSVFRNLILSSSR